MFHLTDPTYNMYPVTQDIPSELRSSTNTAGNKCNVRWMLIIEGITEIQGKWRFRYKKVHLTQIKTSDDNQLLIMD